MRVRAGAGVAVAALVTGLVLDSGSRRWWQAWRHRRAVEAEGRAVEARQW